MLPRQKGLTVTDIKESLKLDPETPSPPDTGCSFAITQIAWHECLSS